MRTTTITLTLSTLFAAGLRADTIEVPGDYPTIGAALAAAGSGDTIEVSSGMYFERVTIPAFKAGLKLEGKGSVIIDVHPSRVGYGYGIRIDAVNVTLENLTIRHARTSGGSIGYGVFGPSNVHGLTLEDVTIEDCGSNAVYVFGNDVRLDDCVIRANFDGVYVAGSGTRVTELTAYSSDTAIEIHGPMVRVEKCDISACETGIDLNAADFGKIRFNTIRGCEEGISGYGASVTISGNEVIGFSDVGIYHEGDFASITKNEVANGGESADGIHLYVADESKVKDNEVSYVGGRGLRVRNSNNVVVQDNELKRCGGYNEPYGMELFDIHFSTVTDNEVVDTCGDGIYLRGDGNVIADNEVKNSTLDGIRVFSGSNNQVIDNKVQNNAGEGLCNSGSSTTWRENSAKKNRIDLANSGTVSSVDNEYKTGGPGTTPEVE